MQSFLTEVKEPTARAEFLDRVEELVANPGVGLIAHHGPRYFQQKYDVTIGRVNRKAITIYYEVRRNDGVIVVLDIYDQARGSYYSTDS